MSLTKHAAIVTMDTEHKQIEVSQKEHDGRFWTGFGWLSLRLKGKHLSIE
jgi:uncharacterized protein YigE (DUF2233 family)